MSKLAVGQLEGLASEGYRISVASGSAFAPVGSILQVVSTTKTDTFTTTSTSYTDITGLSVSITPTYSSSKLIVAVNLGASVSGDIAVFFRQMRDSTAINIGNAEGNRTRASASVLNNNTVLGFENLSWQFLDSPATTSSTVYKVQMMVNTGTGYVGRSGADDNAATRPRVPSTITVLEVAG